MFPRKTTLTGLASLILFAALPHAAPAQTAAAAFFREGAIRVLILSGRNNHDWRTTTPFIRRILAAAAKFDTRVVEEPAGLTPEALAPYDVILLDYNGPRWSQAAENAVGAFVRNGKGLVVVHGASYAFGLMEVLGDGHKRTGLKEPPWTEFGEMVGATWTEGPPRSGHGQRHIFEVKFTDREHPIAKGVAEKFPISDELYHNLVLKPGIKVLARAFDDPKIGGTGKDEPILLTLAYGNGRVFHTALGHDTSAMQSSGFITTLARGTEWAATGKVTLPAVIQTDAVKKDAVRVEVVIGGHDFSPTLWQLFDGQEDILANVVYQPSAYTADRLKNTDVLVLYDLMQTISEEHKANLRRFLESGKGLVVLHHAIADYQEWKWWYEDVVGGRYVLKADTHPASSFLHDVEMFVNPAGDHPVTRGVGPLVIFDETYKQMWISPKVQVVLKTNHPTSDGPVAWISPYDKSRVVYLQLGHGAEAHRHSAFQRLVRNAMLWAGGKM